MRMSKDFAREFYSSVRWQKCRNAYMAYRHGICERCAEQGKIKPAAIVHHKIELTPENINNPRIALSFSNLKALCRECHLIEHGMTRKRYWVKPNGEVVMR